MVSLLYPKSLLLYDWEVMGQSHIYDLFVEILVGQVMGQNGYLGCPKNTFCFLFFFNI